MPPIPLLARFALLAIAPAIPPQDGAGPPADDPDDAPPAVAHPSAPIEEDLAMLEALLRVRESRVAEARRLLELETDVLATVREQRRFNAAPPRQVELIEVRVAGASALVDAREAERDEVAIRLEQLRRRAALPSPEPDRDERRARLDDLVRIREVQLRAREARLRAAEAQLASERNSQANFVDGVRRGIASPGAGRQAIFRVAEATTWRDTMAAERDAARILLQRARRRLAQFDDPNAADPDLDRPTLEDHEDRLVALEHLVDVLRDEMYHMQWELQLFRNQQHERFGTADRLGTPPTVPGR